MELFQLVSAGWVEAHLDSPEILVLDPRSAMRYMAGHPKNAVNVPISKTRDAGGALLPPAQLARWLGSAGLDDHRMPVIYDGADGRNAAFLAWILAYLGRDDVRLMETLWEKWAGEGREVFYRPVRAAPREFAARPRAKLRATLEDVQALGGRKLVDFRSREEFDGRLDTEGRPGHIPGAAHVDWRELCGKETLLAPKKTVERIFSGRGFACPGGVVAYCRTGVRAALGFLALAQLGFLAALYDGSYAEWAKSGLPVECPVKENARGERQNA